MNARDMLERCVRSFVMVRRVGDRVELEALFPDEHPLTSDLIELMRSHKPEIIRMLWWQEQADALLLDSTRRIAAAWPASYPLEGPEWAAHERMLHDAYWSEDLESLAAVLGAREDYALSLFDRYRKKVTR